MQEGKHPNTHALAVNCTSCSASYTITSVAKKDQLLDSCPNCHTVYTGKQRDTSNTTRAQDFMSRYAQASGGVKGDKKH